MTTRVRAERVATGHGTRFWVDETCWAELPELEEALDERLSAADGWQSAARLHRGLGPEQRDRLDALLGLFNDTGLAVPGSERGRLAGLRVAVAGSGRLARQLAQALLRAGVRHLECLDEAPPDPVLWPGSRHATGGAALAGWLRPRHHVQVSPAAGVQQLAAQGVDVVLVAGPTVEPDRLLLHELARHDLVHLVLGCHADLGRVGPLVMPGRTPCMQCHDLARGAQDAGWTHVVAELSHRPARPDPTMAMTVAARGVLELGWLAHSPDAWRRLSGRAEVIDLHHPQPREVRFAQHPECSCAWRP